MRHRVEGRHDEGPGDPGVQVPGARVKVRTSPLLVVISRREPCTSKPEASCSSLKNSSEARSMLLSQEINVWLISTTASFLPIPIL